MIYFEKFPPAPDCLEAEKSKELEKEQGLRKTGGKYDCGCVLEQLQKDSKNKCYICESKSPTTIHIEHFKPHLQGKKIDLKFDWNNLFFSCGHCNTTKSNKFDDILNCTDLNDDVENALSYEFKPFPHEDVVIKALNNSAKTENTRDLLLAVFNGTTKLKQIEANNLRDELLKEIRKYQEHLCDYYEAHDQEHQNDLLFKIKSHLHSASAFTAFKRQIIKDNSKLWAEFGSYIQTN